jgi:hypothetical protein
MAKPNKKPDVAAARAKCKESLAAIAAKKAAGSKTKVQK